MLLGMVNRGYKPLKLIDTSELPSEEHLRQCYFFLGMVNRGYKPLKLVDTSELPAAEHLRQCYFFFWEWLTAVTNRWN